MKTQLFIAAGGKGKRLGQIAKNLPKSMVPILGQPIIGHVMTSARQADIYQVVVGVDDGKEDLECYVRQLDAEIERNCVEPLTGSFFHSAKIRKPDVIIGTNGDTIYRPESLRKLVSLLLGDDQADAALLLTSVTRPISTSNWTYWLHRIENSVVISMEEVPGHEIKTEFMTAAFRVESLRELSNDFTEDFQNHQHLPFTCFSLGWDYLLRLMLWKGFKIAGLITQDLSLNINYPIDLIEGEYFFTAPELFRQLRTKPSY